MVEISRLCKIISESEISKSEPDKTYSGSTEVYKDLLKEYEQFDDDALEKRFKQSPGLSPEFMEFHEDKFYENLFTDLAKKYNYSLKDIEELSKIIPRYGQCGLFLSSLINKIIRPEDTITIHPNPEYEICEEDETISNIGYLLPCGKLIISEMGGDIGQEMKGGLIEILYHTGNGLGKYMRGGHIIARKNAGCNAGEGMVDGQIEIFEDADESLGKEMRGGKIIARKNVGPDAGTGMKNGQIEIFGDADYSAGAEMKGGKITIHGNVEDRVGESMSDGEIFVEGDAGESVGEGMSGGKITIHGDAGDCLGASMSGGEILVEGNADDHVGQEMEDGEIVVQGIAGDEVADRMTGGAIYFVNHYPTLSPWSQYGTVYYKGEKIT